MDWAKRSHHRPFSDRDVPPQGCGIGQDDVVADDAIVCNMRIGHDQRVTAYAGHSAALDRTPVDGDKLANFVVVSDLETCWFTGVGEVLWRHADRREGKETIVRPDFGR